MRNVSGTGVGVSRCKFTMEQRKAAVAYYQEHGQNLARTVKKLGYPSRATLFNWLKEDIGRATHPCHSGSPVVKLQQDQKEQAVIDLCIRESSAEKLLLNMESAGPLCTNGKMNCWEGNVNRKCLNSLLFNPMMQNSLQKTCALK